MSIDYSEQVAKFKYDKAIPLDDIPIIGKKKKKKQHKKSDHKHIYVPAIFYSPNSNFIRLGYGFYCNQCGRIQNMWWCWNNYLDSLKKFEDQHPDLIQIELPQDWNWIFDKYLPIGE